MNLIGMAAQLFISKLGSGGDQLHETSVVKALLNLLPTQDGELDLAALVAQFTGGGEGLASLASSWLGAGTNAELSPAQLLEVLGSERVADFASALGLDLGTSASGLAQMIPALIDSNSESGELLGGAIGNMAKGILGKLF